MWDKKHVSYLIWMFYVFFLTSSTIAFGKHRQFVIDSGKFTKLQTVRILHAIRLPIMLFLFDILNNDFLWLLSSMETSIISLLIITYKCTCVYLLPFVTNAEAEFLNNTK